MQQGWAARVLSNLFALLPVFYCSANWFDIRLKGFNGFSLTPVDALFWYRIRIRNVCLLNSFVLLPLLCYQMANCRQLLLLLLLLQQLLLHVAGNCNRNSGTNCSSSCGWVWLQSSVHWLPFDRQMGEHVLQSEADVGQEHWVGQEAAASAQFSMLTQKKSAPLIAVKFVVAYCCCCCWECPLDAFWVRRLLKIYAVYERQRALGAHLLVGCGAACVWTWLMPLPQPLLLLLLMMMWQRAIKQQFSLGDMHQSSVELLKRKNYRISHSKDYDWMVFHSELVAGDFSWNSLKGAKFICWKKQKKEKKNSSRGGFALSLRFI